MSRNIKLLALILVLISCIALSCTDRGVNSSGIVLSGGELLVMRDHVFYPYFLFQIKNPSQQISFKAFVPENSLAPTFSRVPMLILLAPEGADENYYFNHGLKEIANEMIATGEIQPMTIVCVPSDRIFGGYFYSGHYPGAGEYDDLFSTELLPYLYLNMPFALNEPAKRSIGGFGQGAYGAFRAALLNKGMFRSVSVVDGPLDFDGPGGSTGLIPLFTDVLNEQGLLNDPLAFTKYDSGTALSDYFIGGSMAFSPDDTTLYWRQIITGPNSYNIVVDSVASLSPGLSATLVERIVTADSRNLDFHLPFNFDGTPYTPIWDMWLNNNLENILADSGNAQLSGVSLWVGTTDEAKYNYHEMTASWISTLRSNGLPVESYEYEGHSGRPATGDQYMYDLLHEMLKFHSDNFGD